MRNKRIYALSVLLFTIYVVNILVGKISVLVRDVNTPIGLGDVSAAFILFASVVLFVAGVFKYEDIKL